MNSLAGPGWIRTPHLNEDGEPYYRLTHVGEEAAKRWESITDTAGLVVRERLAQDARWGEQNHPDGTGLHHYAKWAAEDAKIDCEMARNMGRMTWKDILNEEVAEAFAESDEGRLVEELIQVAAVAQCWIESIRRRQARRVSHVASDGAK